MLYHHFAAEEEWLNKCNLTTDVLTENSNLHLFYVKNILFTISAGNGAI